MRKFFLTLFYSGLCPKAPGTMGSLIALLLSIPILKYLNSETLFLLSILISIIAIKQIDIYEKEVKIHDSKEIVIDELVGMWITISIVNIAWNDYTNLFLAFALFRFYDIKKISIIKRIDENVSGGLGVIGDDIVAGIMAGYSLLLINYFSKSIFA